MAPRATADLDPSKSRGSSIDPLRTYFSQMTRTPLLMVAQEVALAKRIEAHDMAAKRALIEANLRLVVNIAKSTSAVACRCSIFFRRATWA